MLKRIGWRWMVAAAVYIVGLLLSRRIVVTGDLPLGGLWPNLAISLVAVSICARMHFGRPIAVILIFLPPIFGAVIAVGVLGIFRTRISRFDLLLSLALIGMSINYGVAALHRPPKSPETWARSMQSPLVIVPTATVAVMLCGWFLNFRQIGLMAAVGLAAAAVFANVVMPRISLPAPRKHWRKMPALLVVILLVAGFGRLRLESGIFTLIVAGWIAMLTVIAALLVRVELVATVMAPVVLGVVLTLGTLGLAGINQINGVAILFLLGTAVDYSVNVFFGRLEAFRGRSCDGEPTVVLSFLMTVCVTGSMFFSSMRMAGILGLIIAGLSFAAAFLLLPAIADWLLPADAQQVAPSIGRAGVKSLYRYLDVEAEQYVTWKLRLDPIFKGIDSAVPQIGQILDAGCGYGQMSNTLALQSSRRSVIGVDRDARKIHVAQRAARTVGNVRFVLGDLLEWEYPNVDCVLLIDVLHYWKVQLQEQIIAKAATCLRENGTLIFREGLRSSSWGHRMVHVGERWSTWTGQNRRGDGLYFQDREFYLANFQRHGLSLRKELAEWGPGSNSVLVLGRDGGA